MQWTMLIHQSEHTLHQILAAFILDLPQIHSSHVPIFICVTSGAAQRTLPRNFNRERRPSAAQDGLPSLNDFARLHRSSYMWPAIKVEIRTTLAGCPRRSEVAIK